VRLRELALIGAGGAVGACARYGVGEAWPTHPGRFPTTTLVINLVGAFLLGALLEWLTRHERLDHWARFALGIGVLGAFTTFSTFATEVALLVRDGHGATAIAYATTSLAGGLGAVLAGLWVAGWRHAPVPAEGES